MRKVKTVLYILLIVYAVFIIATLFGYFYSLRVFQTIDYTLENQTQVTVTNIVYAIISLVACFCGYWGSKKKTAIPMLICILWVAYRCVQVIRIMVANGMHSISLGGTFYSGTAGNYLVVLLHLTIILLAVVILLKNRK